jgi:integrase
MKLYAIGLTDQNALNMKCTFYLDRPYNPEIDSELLKKEIDRSRSNGGKLNPKFYNPKPTSVYLFFSPDKRTRMKFRTAIKVHPKYWDFKLSSIKPAAPAALELNHELNVLADQVLKSASRLRDEKEKVTRSEYKDLVNHIINKNELPTSREKLSVHVNQFLRFKYTQSTEGTMKEYRTVFNALTAYQEKYGLNMSLIDFDHRFFHRFEEFLCKRKWNMQSGEIGLLNDTIAKYISTIKVFLSWTNREGNSVHPDALRPHKSAYKRKQYNEIVVLSEDEVQRILEYDFSLRTNLDRVRDLFCFACFTGQRYSDIMRFDKLDFKDNKWTFLSAKSKKRVTVPFNGYIAQALPILEKYDFELPKISNQKFNTYLKEIGKIVGIDDPVKITRFRGLNEVVTERPKYKFMSSHMGRRTLVTILLSKGVPITLVQKITQHSDIRTLMKYESANTDQLIDALDKL